jgi:GNAT superfamily N-acetyltransferase
VEDPMPAIRKSLIRFRTKKIVTIRQLATRDELRKYFALRYKVWKALNYIAPEKDCPQSQWELDFTDRFAYPLGAFLKTDPSELVGCVRVVHAFGTVARNYVKMINDLIADHPPLKKCFKLPDAIQHPFDIESFPDFPAYYRRFICEGIPHAEVSRVIVEETFRKKGIGEALVDSAISLARRQGVEVMFLACLSKHESFYNRCGFKTIEVKAANGTDKQMKCSCFVNVEVPAIAMECWLV